MIPKGFICRAFFVPKRQRIGKWFISQTSLKNKHDYDKIMICFGGGKQMPKIRPVSDLRNHFAEISRLVHETKQPVFLTKNGYGDMVVMSMETFERLQPDGELSSALREKLAQLEEEARMEEGRPSD